MEIETINFFDAWTTYDRILDFNYMFHNEIYAELEQFIATKFAHRPLSLIDLGCGSARHLATALSGQKLEHYVGYDLSKAALSQAAKNLSGVITDPELHQGDLSAGLVSQQHLFDIVFTSFALHHLEREEKAKFFRLAYERLETGGLLLLVDVMRDEDEDLSSYLRHYCGWIRSNWVGFSEDTLNAICVHINGNDLPEIPSVIENMARAAGFVDCREIGRIGWHRSWCFEKH